MADIVRGGGEDEAPRACVRHRSGRRVSSCRTTEHHAEDNWPRLQQLVAGVEADVRHWLSYWKMISMGDAMSV